MCKPLLIFLYFLHLPAYAVDGAGMPLPDVIAIFTIIFFGSMPFVIALGLVAFIIFVVIRLMRGSSPPSIQPLNLLPPASDEIQFSNEEADLMQRKNIFFNGHRYRYGNMEYETLSEALSVVESNKK